ncbi:unnamed protein product [marine sediment metagenome]|uniref:Uncharacterized protein n=1 Tax=marine sediment metagenome TaxID=412755 RepID=X1HL49_9ZZZZ
MRIHEICENIDEVRFNVPAGVSDVVLTIVHTDNYERYLEEPRLHTYLFIKTWKAGSESPVKPKIKQPGKYSHAKKLIWRYSRGTIGPWRFSIIPKNVDIPKVERSAVSIRYGAVVELIARRPGLVV